MVQAKTCSECKQEKSLEDFYPKKSGRLGRMAICKSCQSAYAREQRVIHQDKIKESRLKNRDRRNESRRLWGEENPNYNKDYYWSHKEAINEAGREWREKNREYIREQARAYYLENRESFIEYGKQYRKLHRKERAEIQRVWRLANPELNLTYKHKRRALISSSLENFTAQEWIDLCELYNYTCLACKRSDVLMTIDHVIPLSKGGGNGIDNIQPLCGSCNSAKHDKFIDYREADK